MLPSRLSDVLAAGKKAGRTAPTSSPPSREGINGKAFNQIHEPLTDCLGDSRSPFPTRTLEVRCGKRPSSPTQGKELKVQHHRSQLSPLVVFVPFAAAAASAKKTFHWFYIQPADLQDRQCVSRQGTLGDHERTTVITVRVSRSTGGAHEHPVPRRRKSATHSPTFI